MGPVTSGNISWDSIKLNNNDDNKENNSEYIWDVDTDYKEDIDTVENKLAININNISTIVLLKDINKNNYLLQLIYLSDLFIFNNKISKLSHSEQKYVYNYLHQLPSSDTSLIAWINSFKILDNDGNYNYTNNLDGDLSDGLILLNILNSIKPNCVNFKDNSIRNEIRHKFDKITNCNILMDTMKNDSTFKDIFHLIGIDGNDIVNGHEKFIRSLLLQIQRYHSTKLMAKILFKKKNVTDDELLIWMNNRLKLYSQMVKAMNKIHHNQSFSNTPVKMKKNINILNFEDKNSLSDSLNFCNIVSSINPNWINYQNINNEMECKNDKNKKLLNGKYLITIMRRLGCDNIFITPKELIQCEHRAILTISTSIMTIAARYKEYDQLALFAKNLKQIKAKMKKK